jgi:predicted ATPase
VLLQTFFLRFYKSFNYDYLRKVHPRAVKDPWEDLDGNWYPHVQLPLDPAVTTIVGANESGKSHLLSAIKKGIDGDGIVREDFCRYSQFFTVEQGKLKWPEFGFEWRGLTDADRKIVASACGLAEETFDHFMLFRIDREKLVVYLPSRGRYSQHQVKTDRADSLTSILPRVFTIDAGIALPESVPIRSLLTVSEDGRAASFAAVERQKRFDLLDSFEALTAHSEWFKTAESVTENAAAIAPAVNGLLSTASRASHSQAGETTEAALKLARDLIFKVARIDPASIEDLYHALREGKDGHANGLIQKINEHLEATLNFPHWWVQDRDFRLTVASRDYDLVFTIRDRTGTEYSFSERSGGMKYFLSYYVQYRAHEPMDKRAEILLMDEPDAYLSSDGQQDLLKILDAFAHPMDGRRPVQVVYVTHSPFLIDKNHAERLRVLEKGVGAEGTRLVNDAAKNHYEPLRSALGAFVAETAFISNCNLVVEGTADQVLLAGVASFLRSKKTGESETLDLNQVTIVPAGSASHIPYLVFLARGRDVEQPAVIVLLDSDTAGNDARKRLKRGGPDRRELIKDSLVFQIGALESEATIAPALPGVIIELEDLIPLPICVRAARRYAQELCEVPKEIAEAITEDAVRRHASQGASTVFKALEAVFESMEEKQHIDKVAFDRFVVDSLRSLSEEMDSGSDRAKELLGQFSGNMRALFGKVNKMRREAERDTRGERVSSRVERTKRSFLLDHPSAASREQAAILLEDIEVALNVGLESDSIRNEVQRLRREFALEIDLTEPVEQYESIKERLESIRYAGVLASQAVDVTPAKTSLLPKAESPKLTAHEKPIASPGPVSIASGKGPK